MAEEKSKNHLTVDPDEFPCPICGEAEFEWGMSVTYGVSERLHHRATGAGWGSGQPLNTRKCLHCSNVQLFTVRKPET